MKQYGIKKEYVPNLDNLYYDDAPDDGIIWQPDVYEYAVAYARRHRIPNIIDIGSGNGEKLQKYKDEFAITFIDFGANLEIIKAKFESSKRKHTYVDQNFEQSFPDLKPEVVKNSVVICSDVIEHIRDFDRLADALVDYSRKAKLLLISTPDRERMYGFDQDGQPLNKCHVREWRLEELRVFFREKGMRFSIGLTRTNDRANQRATLFVLSGVDFDKSTMRAPELTQFKDGYLTKVILKDDLCGYLDGKGIVYSRMPKTALGLFNLLDDNYLLNHYLNALGGGFFYTVNHFKFVNQDAEHKFYNSGIENIDRLIVQYVKTTKHGDKTTDHYPISFSFIHGASLITPGNRPLLTFSVEQLRTQYLPEFILGFDNIKLRFETATLLSNQANLDRDKLLQQEVLESVKAEAHQLQQKNTDLEQELRRLYRNPAYYIARGGKKVLRKAIKKQDRD